MPHATHRAAAVTLTTMLALLVWAAPAQAAEPDPQAGPTTAEDFTWPTPPHGPVGPIINELPDLPDLPVVPGSLGDFTWP